MKPLASLLGTFTILVTLAFLTGGCDKSPTVYKSLNGRTVLTLVSKDECEWAEDGTTLLYKYTKANNTLRIVATALGTTEVIYMRFTDQGLEDNKANVLLSPDAYAAAVTQLKRQQRETEAAQEKERLEKERERLEKKRVAKVIASSTVETRTISTFSTASVTVTGIHGSWPIDISVAVTDVSLKLRSVGHLKNGGTHRASNDVYFSQIRKIGDIKKGAQGYQFLVDWNLDNDTSYYSYGGSCLYFTTEGEARASHDLVLNAFNAWKQTFPEAVSPAQR
jgi:hypothetical protein